MENDAYDQEATAPKRVPWNADNTTANGPTSLDVLLMWMLTPGKYKRLHGEHPSKAILSILAALKKQGLHRTESGIRSKVRSIENQYIAAKRWLDERNIDGNDILTGKSDNETVSEVLSICPHFNKLMPVFRHSSVLNEAAQATIDQAEVTDSDNRAKKLARSKAKRKAKKESQRPRKRQTTSSEIARSEVEDEEDRSGVAILLNCVRRTTGALDLSGSQKWFERTDHCELVVRDPDAQLPSEFRREMAEVRLDHEKKQNQCIRESDAKMRDEMMKCDIEVRRGRGEVQLILDRVLARQGMKQLGVPKEDIDVAMSLKE